MLWQRILFGSMMIAAVVGLVVLDVKVSTSGIDLTAATQSATSTQPTVLPVTGLPLTLLVVAMVTLAAREMGRLCRAGGYTPATPWAAFVSAGLVFVPWIEMYTQLGHSSPLLASAASIASPTVIWIVGGFLGACLATMARKTTERALSNMALTVFIFLYLGLLGSFWVRIRCLSPGSAGAILMVYVLLTIKSGDIGAYFTGIAIGRHKLAPWLSPGKTVEGLVGALVASVIVAMAGMAIWPSVAGAEQPVPLKMSQAAVLGLLMAITGHLGDLVESAFKRDMRIKDSGNLVPSFGGLLDLMDSTLFGAPIAWLALTFWGCFDYN